MNAHVVLLYDKLGALDETYTLFFEKICYKFNFHFFPVRDTSSEQNFLIHLKKKKSKVRKIAALGWSSFSVILISFLVFSFAQIKWHFKAAFS